MDGATAGAPQIGSAADRIERPRRRPEIRAFIVKDEAVLVRPRKAPGLLEDSEKNRAVTLNSSSRAIWDLCDGNHTVDEIAGALEARFPVDRIALRTQVDDAIARMAKLGFLDGIRKRMKTISGTTFVLGIEDLPFFWWQTAIFLESLRGKLPDGWRTLVVVCKNHGPISDELGEIISTYKADVAQGTNYAQSNKLDFGWNGGQSYAALNRVEALSVAADWVDDDDVICLLDSDTFFYRDINFDIMPKRCAAPLNWHVEAEPFFSSVKNNQGRGVNLAKLLEAIGCDETFRPGAVNVFVTGKVAKNRKFVADCFRFAQSLYLLGRIAGAPNTWLAEMPCFTLAMTANGIAWDLLEKIEFLVSSSGETEIPTGTLYHYYADPMDNGNGAFRGSKWHKQAYRQENFLLSDFRQFVEDAKTEHEKYFFQLALSARERLYV